MTPDGRWGVGVVGLGIGRLHAQAVIASPRAFLRAVCTRQTNPQAAELGAAAVTTRYQDLLADPEVDLVCLAVPPDLHEPLALEAAAAGKHLLIEKPLARTLPEADRILAAVRRHGVALHVGHNQRWLGQYARAKALLAELGPVHLAQANVHVFGSIGGFRTSLDANGGGTLIDSGVHRFDLLQWLAGPVESVSALTSRALQPQMEGEDCAVAALRFASGALGTVSCSWSAAGPEREESLRLYARRGGLVADDHLARLRWGTPPDSRHEAFGIDQARSIGLSLQAFLESLDAGQPAPVTGEEGRSALAVALACYASAALGRPVRVPGPETTEFRAE